MANVQRVVVIERIVQARPAPSNELAPFINYAAMTDEELADANKDLIRNKEFITYLEKNIDNLTRQLNMHKRSMEKKKRDMILNRVNYLRLEKEVKARMYPETKTKVLSKAKWNAPMEDVCGICMDNHSMCDTLLTSCNHQFGKACYEKWAEIRTKSHLCVSCPMCKSNSPKITLYKQRAPVVRKPAAIAEADVAIDLTDM